MSFERFKETYKHHPTRAPALRAVEADGADSVSRGLVDRATGGCDELASGLEVEDLGAEWPDYRHPKRPEFLLTTPHRHGTSGFFIARLRVPALLQAVA